MCRVLAGLCFGSPCFWHREISWTLVLVLEAKCSMCSRVLSVWMQNPGSFCIVATFSYSCSLPYFFLSSLSLLAVPDRMGLSLSLCLRLTVTPIPLREGQGLANRWRACSVMLLWLSYTVLCRVPLPFAHYWVRGLWWFLLSPCQGSFDTGTNSYTNFTEHLLLIYFAVLIHELMFCLSGIFKLFKIKKKLPLFNLWVAVEKEAVLRISSYVCVTPKDTCI